MSVRTNIAALACLAFALPAVAPAQTAPSPDLRIASPNRVDSRQLAARAPSLRIVAPRGSGDTMLVDANGRAIGRRTHSTINWTAAAITVQVNGHAAILFGMGLPAYPATGMVWTDTDPYSQVALAVPVVYYDGAACTGSPYMSYAWAEGFDYAGVPMKDNGTLYMHLFDATQPVQFTSQSIYNAGGCFAASPQNLVGAPLMAVTPVSTLGTPPFTWR